MLLPLIPDPTPRQADLCAEFESWCARHRLPTTGGAEALLQRLLSRQERRWLLNFIVRWDWAGEDAARAPAALVEPLELAAVFLQVVRENCSRGEFDDIRAGRRAIGDVLHVGSAIDQAFARAHRVPIDGPRTLDQRVAEDKLKAEALVIVSARYERQEAVHG
ncbi:MAG: hypothetical protein ACTHK2_04585 [Dokdonella sp.]|uniref:hypothetical protein n=1 Tax=Dokdonella sp. TaxID=2291710 RepID=UPI003F820590